MRFRRYQKGDVVAYAYDDAGSVGLRYPDGRGLLRTSDGIPKPVVDGTDVADVAEIFSCIAGGLDEDACARRGVEAHP